MRVPVKFAATSVAAAVALSLFMAAPTAATPPPGYTCTKIRGVAGGSPWAGSKL